MKKENEFIANNKKVIELITEYEKQYPGDKGAISLYSHTRNAIITQEILTNRNNKKIKITENVDTLDGFDWEYE